MKCCEVNCHLLCWQPRSRCLQDPAKLKLGTAAISAALTTIVRVRTVTESITTVDTPTAVMAAAIMVELSMAGTTREQTHPAITAMARLTTTMETSVTATSVVLHSDGNFSHPVFCRVTDSIVAVNGGPSSLLSVNNFKALH